MISCSTSSNNCLINLKLRLFIIFVNDSSLTFGTFLQVALRWRIEKEVIDGKGGKLNLNHNHWWYWEFKVHLIFLKIHFENENFYFGNWNIISDIKIMLKIKISFNVWSAHWRNWDLEIILRKSLLEMAILILGVKTLILKISLGN